MSYQQLGSYQKLSTDILEHILEQRSLPPSIDSRLPPRLEDDLVGLQSLETTEVELSRTEGDAKSTRNEHDRIGAIRSIVAGLVLGDRTSTPTTSEASETTASTYRRRLEPMLGSAIENEEGEIRSFEHAMRRLRMRMDWFARAGAALQVSVIVLLLALANLLVIDPVTRLVQDIREFGRDRLGHRVAVRRHDEFGLLAQHINRMAHRLERNRDKLRALNNDLEQTVASRTKALVSRNEELREIDESRRRFFGDVSHELRTPLTAIVGEADVSLRAASPDVASYRAALTSVRANAGLLNRRIDDLMALARSSDGRLELRREIIDVNLVAASAAGEIESLARLSSVRTSFSFCDEPVVVRGDWQKIKQVLLIVLDNAVKFTRAGQSIEVDIGRIDIGGAAWATMTVTDHGRGITERDLPHVFERYYQADVGRRKGGTGLGLAIARQIAIAHGGSIDAVRGMDGGTVVTVRLQLVEGAEA